MSLEDLVNITVTTASGVEDSLIDATAVMIVCTSNDLKYIFAASFYKSDEEDISNCWGFLSNDVYSNDKICGPILTSASINKLFVQINSQQIIGAF